MCLIIEYCIVIGIERENEIYKIYTMDYNI